MKKTSNASGDKLDRTGGKITGNLNIEGTLKNNNKTILDLTYPIGSIYLSVKSTNPSSLFGGTWVAWGNGRVPVGVDNSDTDFNAVEKTGGEKTHILSVEEIPSHIHSVGTWYNSSTGAWGNAGANNEGTYTEGAIATNSTGGNQAHNNMQPYITCYMFKRVG